MSIKSLTQKLNSQSNNSNLTLLGFEDDFSVVKLCSSLIVSGRVLIVCTDKNQRKIIEVEKALIKKGFKVSIIEFRGNANNLVDLSKLFSASEDVRVAITIENSLAIPTSYFASVNDIYSIIVTSDVSMRQVFAKKIIINTGNGLDQVLLNDKRHILIDESIIDKPFATAQAFADIQSKAISLLEYRLRDKVINTGLNLNSYSQIRNAILETFSVFAHSKKAQKELLLNSLIKVYFADYLANGSVFFGQITNVTSLLLDSENGLDKLKVQKFTLSLLEAMFSKKYENILDCPDYLMRSKYLISKYNVDQTFFYEHFLQTSNLTDKISQSDFASLQKEVQALVKSCDRMINIYLALGGEMGSENERIAKSIKYAGDLPFCINSSTFLRENGILEYL